MDADDYWDLAADEFQQALDRLRGEDWPATEVTAQEILAAVTLKYEPSEEPEGPAPRLVVAR